jgi:hypothetical protein
MPNLPFSPTNPIQPSDFMKDDIPAETDDLQLGRKNPEDGANTDAEHHRDDRPQTVPQAGRR